MIVALIDDDKAVLESLGLLLKNRGLAVECFISADEFLARIDSFKPGCIISDIRMPGRSGLDLQHILRERNITIPLILITGHGDIAMAVTAVKLGAFDFIEKPFDDLKLTQSITRAIESGAQFRSRQEEIAGVLARVSSLSERQREVMNLAAEGLSNKEIAMRMGISPRTVENYRAWVMEKMGVANLAELVRMVIRLEAVTEINAQHNAGTRES